MTSSESITSDSRESLSSSSSSRSDFLTELRLGFLREREDITYTDTLSKRFEKKYGIPYSPTKLQAKKIDRGRWLHRRSFVMEWIVQSGITYISRLHRELEDNGYEIAKGTLNDFVEYLIEDQIIDFIRWYPKSKKYHYTKFLISPECSNKKIEETISNWIEKDEYYFNKTQKSPKQIFEETKQRTKAQSDAYAELRNEKRKIEIENPSLSDKSNAYLMKIDIENLIQMLERSEKKLTQGYGYTQTYHEEVLFEVKKELAKVMKNKNSDKILEIVTNQFPLVLSKIDTSTLLLED